MRSCGKFVGAAACSLVTTAASADAVFNIWVDAPAEVMAGETFTASVWAEVSGSILDSSDGGFQGLSADLLASGIHVQFSTASFPFMNTPFDFGTPDFNALRSIVAGNFPYFLGFAGHNPLRLFDVEVTTDQDAFGPLELTVLPAGSSSLLSWWLDHGDLTYILDTDPGSSRIITPATVNVIPAPASLGLLVLAGVGAARRRR